MLTKLGMRAKARLGRDSRSPRPQNSSPYASLLDVLKPASLPRRVLNKLTKLTRRARNEDPEAEVEIEVQDQAHVQIPEQVVAESVVEGCESSNCSPTKQPQSDLIEAAAEPSLKRLSPASSLLTSNEGMLWLAFQQSTEHSGNALSPITVSADDRADPAPDWREPGHIPAEHSDRMTVHSSSSSWETFTNSSTSPGRETPAKSEAAAVTSDEARAYIMVMMHLGNQNDLRSSIDTSSPSSDLSTVVPARTPRSPELQRLFTIGAISFEEAVVNIRAATANALLSQSLVPAMGRETSTEAFDERPPPLVMPRRRGMESEQTPTDAVLVSGNALITPTGADAAQPQALNVNRHRNWDSLSTTVSELHPIWANHGLQQPQALAQVPASTASQASAPAQPAELPGSEQTAAPQSTRTKIPVQERRWADMSSNISVLSPGFPKRGLPQHQESPTPAGRNRQEVPLPSTLGTESTSTRGRVLHVNRRGGLGTARGHHTRGDSNATANNAFFNDTRAQRPDSHPGPVHLGHDTGVQVPIEQASRIRPHPFRRAVHRPSSTPQDVAHSTFPNGLANIQPPPLPWRRPNPPGYWNPPSFNVAFHDTTRDRARNITPDRHSYSSVGSSPLSNHFVDATTPFEPRPPSPPLPTNVVENLEARVQDFRGFFEGLQQQRDALRTREQEIAAEKAAMETELRELDVAIAREDRRQVALYEECMAEGVNADALIARAEREVLDVEEEAEGGNGDTGEAGGGQRGNRDEDDAELGDDVLAADREFNSELEVRSQSSGMGATEGFMNLNVHRWLEARSTSVAVADGEVLESPAVREATRLLRVSSVHEN
ncbi:uncharacterized protein AB675_9068 [Cyphellophora attinorum]|uniref:Uncharacterized protein n=1 Tax=Cyphellophora attinorum TaxID=1664694 RepID=A0A0N1P223_9EURO|nr:uncharacterized protein AB675_9068 [Phialophora attinorum]KPI41694.1 hypothetical protein AB675_9068 [Phialophora attinorum]